MHHPKVSSSRQISRTFIRTSGTTKTMETQGPFNQRTFHRFVPHSGRRGIIVCQHGFSWSTINHPTTTTTTRILTAQVRYRAPEEPRLSRATLQPLKQSCTKSTRMVSCPWIQQKIATRTTTGDDVVMVSPFGWCLVGKKCIPQQRTAVTSITPNATHLDSVAALKPQSFSNLSLLLSFCCEL